MTLMFPRRQLRGSSQDERSDLIEALQYLAAGKVRYRAVLHHGA